MFRIANTIHKFQSFILLKREFKFQLPIQLGAMRSSNIKDPLAQKESEKNCGSSNTTFNIYMKNFQCNQTILWRGTSPKTSLIVPPISVENKTMNKGMEKVILLLLDMFVIL